MLKVLPQNALNSSIKPTFTFSSDIFVVVVVVVSHIQRIGCQPEKKYQVLYTVANPARGLLNKGKKEKRKKKKSGSAPPPPPARCSFGEKKKKKKSRDASTCLARRYEGRRYAGGGLGPSRVRTRIPTTRRLDQWVSLRKILRFRVRLQLSQSRCLSLLLAMSGRVFLLFPPRGHEPPPTLRDRLNPIYSAPIAMHSVCICCTYRHLFPVQQTTSGIGVIK